MQTRDRDSDPFSPPTTFGPPLNVNGFESFEPSISRDELELYFVTTRLGGNRLFVARRSDPRGEFTSVEPIAEIDGRGPDISSDGRHLFFHAFDGANHRVYEMTRCL